MTAGIERITIDKKVITSIANLSSRKVIRTSRAGKGSISNNRQSDTTAKNILLDKAFLKAQQIMKKTLNR
jgi:hypothetical protein